MHRDLKPGNVLITADGTPKLLDFGIAKILNAQSFQQEVEATGAFIRLLTPEFASPEQVRGEPVTTASDVYSLGVVLYLLLTGERPYQLGGTSSEHIAKAVCAAQPLKPSNIVRRAAHTTPASESHGKGGLDSAAAVRATNPQKLSRLLAGDLDNIVLMALRKEPQRRYSSVEQFSEDIRRYLEGLPITARKDTYIYRARKFVRRNKLSVTAAALVFLSLVVGMLATLRQAHIARAERARAERRFQDVRALANSLLFDVHDSIQNLPGSTPARKLLVDRALRYLDTLAAEAGGDTSLQRELATAYQKVGTVEGNSFSANLGDIQGAARNYRKAQQIWESLARIDPSVQNELGLMQTSRLLAQVLCNSGDGDCMQAAERSVTAAEYAAKIAPNNAEVRAEQVLSYDLAATALDGSGDFNKSLGYLSKELEIEQQRLAKEPHDEVLQRQLGVVHVKMADELARICRRKEALEHSLYGLKIFLALAADPSNARYRRELAVVEARRGDILLLDGNNTKALESYRLALATLQPLIQADPQNALLNADLAFDKSRLGTVLNRRGSRSEAITCFRDSIAILQRELAHDSSNAEVRKYLALAYTAQGDTWREAGSFANALESYKNALADFQAISRAYFRDQTAKVNVARLQLKIASLLTQQGSYATAEKLNTQALQAIEPLASGTSPTEEARYALIEAYYGMGTLSASRASRADQSPHRRAQHWREAREYYAKALQASSSIQNAGAVSTQLFSITPRATIVRALARCDVALAGFGTTASISRRLTPLSR